ncbi:hypothetical protein Pla123a_47790 [Posidoniimonas polymericola]|uniref:Matrixin n=1 Tax=Posidoniimonas polymericola TaxID=2528002 RepID=A0A5C5XW89_9BACT|nr:Ig-like domain-containing protein [Posidoniimonas polymericola]TWT66255.1 hypothetical protein Pla123a_47790 [Posidoniimonas polymericola]
MRHRLYNSKNRLPLQFEPLERRELLDGDGLTLANDAYLSLSFVADGVDAAGQSSALHAAFNAIAPEATWKQAILSAFQSWAVHTNADIGLCDDGGQAFGSPGASLGDPRFGDIRVGAVLLDPSIGAVSVPMDGVVGGSWLGDVLFNTQFNFTSVDDIYAIALHEAGNVFGLEDSADPNSPLHPGPIPTATQPTTTDVANLQDLYGVRSADLYETLDNRNNPDNNVITSASRIAIEDTPPTDAGKVPSILYADISSAADVDFFRLPNLDNYTGPLTFEVRTAGISLLTPEVTIYDDSQQPIATAASTSMGGDTLTITLPTSVDGRDYYIEVKAAAGADYERGGYSLTTTFDDLNEVPDALIERYADGSLRKLTPKQISKVLEPDEDDFFEQEDHENNTFGGAAVLELDADFAVGARYSIQGAITTADDVDFFEVDSPEVFAGPTGTLTVAVRSLEAGGLVPRVTVNNHDGNLLPTELLMNGSGQLVLQVSGVLPSEDYYIGIQADDPDGFFNTGNYELTASFQDASLSLPTFAEGTLAPTDFGVTHTFYVAEPQLFHFLLESTGGAPLSAVVATIRTSDGEAVYRIAGPAGTTRSQLAVLLPPGEYTADFNTVSLYEPLSTPVTYRLAGAAFSDPFAGDPDDPNAHPFACPDPELAGFFCYPGDFLSADPYLWEDFVASQTEPPPETDLQQLVVTLLSDWWSWVWDQVGANGPVLAQGDRFDVQTNSPIGVDANVLTNDIDPEGGDVVAVLETSTTHGQLQLAPNGAITYTPDPGFAGTDSFRYFANDFVQNSSPATVYLVVGSGITGDYNGDGLVDSNDLLTWKTAYGSATELLADGNKNMVVDAGDYALLRDAIVAAAAPVALPAAALARGTIVGDPSTTLPLSLSSQPAMTLAEFAAIRSTSGGRAQAILSRSTYSSDSRRSDAHDLALSQVSLPSRRRLLTAPQSVNDSEGNDGPKSDADRMKTVSTRPTTLLGNSSRHRRAEIEVAG